MKRIGFAVILFTVLCLGVITGVRGLAHTPTYPAAWDSQAVPTGPALVPISQSVQEDTGWYGSPDYASKTKLDYRTCTMGAAGMECWFNRAKYEPQLQYASYSVNGPETEPYLGLEPL